MWKYCLSKRKKLFCVDHAEFKMIDNKNILIKTKNNIIKSDGSEKNQCKNFIYLYKDIEFNL